MLTQDQGIDGLTREQFRQLGINQEVLVKDPLGNGNIWLEAEVIRYVRPEERVGTIVFEVTDVSVKDPSETDNYKITYYEKDSNCVAYRQ